MPYFVLLKPNHQLTVEQTEMVRVVELPTPEERWPFPEDIQGSDLIEVYKKGSLKACQDFIAKVEDANLREAFETIER